MKGLRLRDFLEWLAILGLLLVVVSSAFYLAVVFVLLQAITHR